MLISEPAKDEASGPSTVSFAPILEPVNEFSFQHCMNSQRNDEIELSDEKREELKGFVPHDDNSFSKSYQKFSYYTQNQGSEYSNR